ncbi:MAG TPA: hypothetical protein VLZ89_10885 [Anaerolineales bacterium]|nr:hypothetical protein [Anaerolineales bacterium]
MPAKKSAPAKAPASASRSSSNDAWKWVYVVGVVVASLAAAFKFTAADPYLGWVLMIVGVLVGLFYFDSADLMNFGIRYLALGLAKAGLDGFLAPTVPVVGPFITGFFTGFFNFLGPVVLAMVVMFFWKKYFGR